jgi:hypothetical protein
MTKTNDNKIWDELFDESCQSLSRKFPEKIDAMLALYRMATEEMPRQKMAAAVFAEGPPSIDWVLDYRRRQFQLLALEYVMLPDDWKDEFIDRLRPWWKLVRENEDRAKAEIAEHKRRRTA